MSTLVVNMFGGPGTGKSTMAMHVAALLKWRGLNIELVSEYAKDKVWEESLKVLDNQVYIFGKQHHRLNRLNGQVQAIITDAPLLLSLVYGSDQPELCELVLAENAKRPNLNIFLERLKAYNPSGRTQDEAGARELDAKIRTMLETTGTEYRIFPGSRESAERIADLVADQVRIRQDVPF